MPNFLQNQRLLLRLLLLLLSSVVLCLLFIAQGEPEPLSVVFHAGFQQLKQREVDVWIGGAFGATNGEATLGVEWKRGFDAVTLRRARDSYLMCDRGRAMFVTRVHADTTTSELWRPHIMHDGTIALASVVNSRYLRLKDDGKLWCDANEIDGAASWRQLMPKQTACLRAGNAGDEDKYTAACWSIIEAETLTRPTILFGTLKPLERAEPKNASDMYDPFIIAKRTLINWARLPGVKPVVLSEDPFSQSLIETINAAYAGRPGFSSIEIISEFEMQKDYGQPTYRGLFRSVIEHYPFAKSIMYANMDILFTSSLANTLDKVQHVYEKRKKWKNKKKKLQNSPYQGWFIVGRRINVDVPTNWSMDTENWDSAIETQLKSQGKMFSSDAEDYFAMSVDLFNWYETPPFIVGGIVFDNWLTSRAVLLDIAGKALAVDVTGTLTAIHQNHGMNVYASLLKPKSTFNIELLKKSGGMPYRLTENCPHYTRYGRRGKFITVADRGPQKPNWVIPDYDAAAAKMSASNNSFKRPPS
ncbi:hypothetical protein ECC02_003319 [Trypanosoma cruzi]|uniref:Uncharacterized protein n=1 Tax=Trypanosoma cruzi TaxID=5693 RepID=A0A7J6YA77_TRYCR|nr:hypothetical protein ECC02_003319 [Trypanosoma cruzi]